VDSPNHCTNRQEVTFDDDENFNIIREKKNILNHQIKQLWKVNPAIIKEKKIG
jgi:hypothetical protein